MTTPQKGKFRLLKWPNPMSYPAGTKWDGFHSVWEATSCWATPAIHAWVMPVGERYQPYYLYLLSWASSWRRGQKFEITQTPVTTSCAVNLSGFFGIIRATVIGIVLFIGESWVCSVFGAVFWHLMNENISLSKGCLSLFWFTEDIAAVKCLINGLIKQQWFD